MAKKPHKVLQAKQIEISKDRPVLIDNTAEIVTVAGNNMRPRKGEGLKEIGLINNGSILVREGRVVAVGPRDVVLSSNDTDDAFVIDARGKLVMPGFVDPHTHLVFGGSRERELRWKIEGASYSDIAARGGGILHTMKATREASLGELLRLGSERLDIMLRHGTTSVETKSGYGLTTENEIKMLEVAGELSRRHRMDISRTFMGAHAIPPEFGDNVGGYVREIVEEMLPIVADKELADFCDVFCEKGFFSLVQSRTILNEAKAYGLVPKIHADELSDLGGASLAAEVEAVSADHLEKSNDEGLREMADKDVVGVLLPGTSFSTDLQYANARHMIDLGVPVALATDFNPNCWTKSMQFMISLACYKMKMFPSEAIVASTINAAHAIGRAHEVGSIEPGKLGDIIILDLENHEQLPYRFASNHVATVLKKGEIVYSRN